MARSARRLRCFGTEENAWNAPIPVIVPAMGFSFTPEQLRFAAVRNGFAMANADGKMLGGAEPFTLRWKGLLLIENEGQYEFSTGAPTPTGQMPDFKKPSNRTVGVLFSNVVKRPGCCSVMTGRTKKPQRHVRSQLR